MTKDVSRYKQFCHFRLMIRSATGTLIVGIDIAKDRHHAFFGTPLLKRKGDSCKRYSTLIRKDILIWNPA